MIQVFDALCKQIRALDLPLNINSLQGISPVFRGAEVGKRDNREIQNNLYSRDLMVISTRTVQSLQAMFI